MESTAYERLASRLEAGYSTNPASFRRSVIALACLPYLVVALLLATTVCIATALIDEASKEQISAALIIDAALLFATLPFTWTSLSALLASPPPPTGRIIKQSEAPRLFELLNKIRRRLGTPAINQVLIDESNGIELHAIPHLGIFGIHQYHLVIGLPYLLGSPTKETVADIARKYALLATKKNGTWFDAWIWSLRPTMAHIHANIKTRTENDLPNRLINSALTHFGIYFSAYSQVIARQWIFVADRAASEIAGQGANGSALIRSALLSSWISESFWPRFLAQADGRETPQFLPYAGMKTAIIAARDEWASQERLRVIMKPHTNPEEINPRLWKRLAAINIKPTTPIATERCSGQTLLTTTLKVLIEEFDATWWQIHGPAWQAHYRKIAQNREQLAALSSRAEETLNPDELLALAQAQMTTGDLKSAIQTTEHLLTRPGAPLAQGELLMARVQLQQGERSGLDKLISAMSRDPSLRGECLRVGYRYLVKTEGRSFADAWASQFATAPNPN